MLELKDTIAGMTSDNYKERFKAEYQQVKIRYERLKSFNTRIEAAEQTSLNHCNPVNPTPAVPMPKHDCPFFVLRDQQRIMGEYLHLLELRAVIEGIDLE